MNKVIFDWREFLFNSTYNETSCGVHIHKCKLGLWEAECTTRKGSMEKALCHFRHHNSKGKYDQTNKEIFTHSIPEFVEMLKSGKELSFQSRHVVMVQHQIRSYSDSIGELASVEFDKDGRKYTRLTLSAV